MAAWKNSPPVTVRHLTQCTLVDRHGDDLPFDDDLATRGAERDRRHRNTGVARRPAAPRDPVDPSWSRRPTARRWPSPGLRRDRPRVLILGLPHVEAIDSAAPPTLRCPPRWRCPRRARAGRSLAAPTSRSVVGESTGTAVPANATIPISRSSGPARRSFAPPPGQRRCESGRRRPPPSTATHRLRWCTVACSRGTVTAVAGRATASTSTTSPASSATAGTWRRQPGRSGATLSSSSRLVKRTAYCSRRRKRHRDRRRRLRQAGRGAEPGGLEERHGFLPRRLARCGAARRAG